MFENAILIHIPGNLMRPDMTLRAPVVPEFPKDAAVGQLAALESDRVVRVFTGAGWIEYPHA